MVQILRKHVLQPFDHRVKVFPYPVEFLRRPLSKRPDRIGEVFLPRLHRARDAVEPQKDLPCPFPRHRALREKQLVHRSERLVNVEPGVTVRCAETIQLPVNPLDRRAEEEIIDAVTPGPALLLDFIEPPPEISVSLPRRLER